MKRRFVFVFVLLLLVYVSAQAVPAYPRKVKVCLADGETAYITLCGDETRKWAVSEDAYTLLPSGDGWVYAEEDINGYACASSFPLVGRKGETSVLRNFKNGLKKNIPVKIQGAGMDRSTRVASSGEKVPMVGTRSALVILMEFADQPFSKTQSDFYRLFNEEGYTDDGAKGSVYDYFTWASHGQLNFICDVVGPFQTEHPMSYYGANSPRTSQDMNPYALFQEAIGYAISQVNLSEYDANGDDYVDNVHIIFSGYGEEAGAPSTAIWSHEMTFDPIMVQGMIIDRYSCAPELRGNSGKGLSRIGPHCHEMGHALGAMDYYDTDYETGGLYAGTGFWDIMAEGSWNEEGVSPAGFNPYVRIYDFGWEEPESLPADSYVTLKSSNLETGHIYQVNTSVDGEFFLLENRMLAGFDSALPGGGLHIYHIGAGLQEKALKNQINATFPQECYLVCASSEYKEPEASSESFGAINSAGALFPGTSGKYAFSDETIPSARLQGGGESGLMLADITLTPDGDISLFHGAFPEPETWWIDTFEEEPDFACWSLSGDLKEQMRTYHFSGKDYILGKDVIFSLSAPDGGNRCAYVENPEAVSYTGSMFSEWIPLSDTSVYLLSFQYMMPSKNAVRKSVFTVYCRTAEDEEFELLGSLSESSTEWRYKELKLPQADSIQLVFSFDVSILSAIALDNVKIGEMVGGNMASAPAPLKEMPPFSIRQSGGDLVVTSFVHSGLLRIFDVNGCCVADVPLSLAGQGQVALPSGFYILQVGDFRQKYIHRP